MKTILLLALLLGACGGSKDDDAPQPSKDTDSCDTVDATSGHTCSSATYASGVIPSDVKADCESSKGTGKGYALASCPAPARGCSCTYDVPESIAGDVGEFTGVEVFYFSSAELASADAIENAYINAGSWCGFLGTKLTTTPRLQCFGLGAPYDGAH